ncbi:MAG: DUF4364 family protein [Nanoarchaeota archaeon]|nr:DUF4364 family protein [Nanoarchaeota archaeon]
MTKKRTRLEVIKDILSVLYNGRDVKITHLIYKANLSNNSIKPYVKELLENQLMEEIRTKNKRTYKITEKGKDFLEEFEKIKIFSEAYGL